MSCCCASQESAAGAAAPAAGAKPVSHSSLSSAHTHSHSLTHTYTHIHIHSNFRFFLFVSFSFSPLIHFATSDSPARSSSIRHRQFEMNYHSATQDLSYQPPSPPGQYRRSCRMTHYSHTALSDFRRQRPLLPLKGAGASGGGRGYNWQRR